VTSDRWPNIGRSASRGTAPTDGRPLIDAGRLFWQ